MLHTINKSPFERNNMDSCFNHAVSGSAILFYEDGVYAALKGTAVSDRVAAKAKDLKVCVLGEDLTARGMSHDQVLDGVKVVDYGGFVDLAADYGTVQAWA